QQLDGPGLALLGPQPHGDGGDEQQVEPRVVGEEGVEVRLSALEEAADVEGEGAGGGNEDGEEHGGQRGREIGGELTLGDDVGGLEGVAHGVHSSPQAWADMVISRKTSSSLPRSMKISSTERLSRRRSSPTALAGDAALFGRARRRTWPSALSAVSTPAISDSAPRALAMRAASASGTRIETAPWLRARLRSSSAVPSATMRPRLMITARVQTA